ncbi:unnamed protein product [marine sediment metagenome]|uniref:Uncharacterized protein n=1 Tax=marine sediment metagenome TaxID=412755 RepID=X1HYK6_9ZZZZ
MNKNKIALWAKRCEVAALKRKPDYPENSPQCSYLDGKAAAYSEAWAMLIFDGEYTPEEYNKANDEWIKKLEEGL